MILQTIHQTLQVNCHNPSRMVLAVWKATRINTLMVKQTLPYPSSVQT
uniref:Uncharacterized protein n=1 Tax=Arundo donax TaxID=35708 RepID=A0A0A9NQ32_ARUDO